MTAQFGPNRVAFKVLSIAKYRQSIFIPSFLKENKVLQESLSQVLRMKKLATAGGKSQPATGAL